MSTLKFRFSQHQQAYSNQLLERHTAPHRAVPEIKPRSENRPIGCFKNDLTHRGYNLRWQNYNAFLAWRRSREEETCTELCRRDIWRPFSNHLGWSETHVYHCARAGTGGQKKYTKKNPHWKRKVESKRTHCQVRLLVKTYPDTKEVLGKFVNENHDHPIGNMNARYTRLSDEDCREIKACLELGMPAEKIMERFRERMFSRGEKPNVETTKFRRRHFIKRSDIRRVEIKLEQAKIWLARNDGHSVLLWVDKLRAAGHYVFLKQHQEHLPDSELGDEDFVLVIQTRFQKQCWKKYGHTFAGLDATHNTTHYDGLSLFTLMGRNHFGHGLPCAYMISSRGTEAVIDLFLMIIRRETPMVIPRRFMSDKDRAQVNAITRRFPEALLMLCWWHVLHAWQQHFVAQQFEELWELLKKWIRVTDQAEFNVYWAKIQSIAPKSVVEYLQDNWLHETKLWSAVHRQNRSIYEESDTNMLLEAWHHFLKGNLLDGKRNRRLDHLLYVLIERAEPHFMAREVQEELGFQGHDLATSRRIQAEHDGARIESSTITPVGDSVFLVQSQSSTDKQYEVDMETRHCTCPAFPSIQFCKHVHAVEKHFPEEESLPIEALNDSEDEPVTAGNVDDDYIAPVVINEDPEDILGSVKNKLLTVFSQLSSNPSHSNIDAIKSLSNQLDDTQAALTQSCPVLPAHTQQRLPPNLNTWNETKSVMGLAVKTSKKRNFGAYSAGQNSGKLAKSDARQPFVDLSQIPPSQPPTFHTPCYIDNSSS